MNGTNCATGKVIIPFGPHYHLYITHVEPGRLKASRVFTADRGREMPADAY